MRLPDVLATWLADLAGCVRFFSRMPVPRLSRHDDPAAMPMFGRAAGLLPLAGTAIAAPAALLAALLAATDLPATAVGALIVLAMVLASGALHEDGLADTADGLAGVADGERRLAIMKDSRIGVFGGVALALSLLLRAALYGHLSTGGAVLAAAGVLTAAAASRTAMVVVWRILPNARPNGLAAAAGRPGRTAVARAVLTASVAVLVAALLFGASQAASGLLLGAIAAALVAGAARRAIGGHTGDVLGACQQVAEAGFLVGLAL